MRNNNVTSEIYLPNSVYFTFLLSIVCLRCHTKSQVTNSRVVLSVLIEAVFSWLAVHVWSSVHCRCTFTEDAALPIILHPWGACTCLGGYLCLFGRVSHFNCRVLHGRFTGVTVPNLLFPPCGFSSSNQIQRILCSVHLNGVSSSRASAKI